MYQTKTLFTWSGVPRSSGVGFFCFHALGDTKQKKPTPLHRGTPLHVNRVLVWYKSSYVLNRHYTGDNKACCSYRQLSATAKILVTQWCIIRIRIVSLRFHMKSNLWLDLSEIMRDKFVTGQLPSLPIKEDPKKKSLLEIRLIFVLWMRFLSPV